MGQLVCRTWLRTVANHKVGYGNGITMVSRIMPLYKVALTDYQAPHSGRHIFYRSISAVQGVLEQTIAGYCCRVTRTLMATTPSTGSGQCAQRTLTRHDALLRPGQGVCSR